MNILLIGSGGREHALAWKLIQSRHCDKLYCAPGNAGIGKIAHLVALDASDQDAVIGFCRENGVEMVVVGPEQPLVDGLVDALDEAGIAAFGPTAKAAQLEGSKGFTKDLCARYSIPTAAYQRFDDGEAAKAYIRQKGAPIVIKADGLAAGKGVVVAMTEDEALGAIEDCFDGSFGEAGLECVVEEFLEGEEASLFALCDGQTAMLLGTAQDHKRVGEGDTGPNTGGMGAYSPAPVLDQAMIDTVMTDIIVPTLAGMAHEGMAFRGILYAGLMITEDGPQLIEYNVRFGDPECQVLMPRLKSDLVELMLAAAAGSLLDLPEAKWNDEAALTVVMASKGYPGSYDKGTEIGSLPNDSDGAIIFHAGTGEKDGKLLATGGRVLTVTALGETVSNAAAKAYSLVDQVDWENGFCRRDIGWRAIEREKG